MMSSGITNLFALAKAALAEKELLHQQAEAAKEALRRTVALDLEPTVQEKKFVLGEIIHHALSAVTALHYHNGIIYIGHAKGTVTALNASTVDTVWEMTTVNEHGYTLPISCLDVVGDVMVVGHDDGEISVWNTLNRSLTHLLPTAHTMKITAIRLINTQIHSTSTSGHFRTHSLHDPTHIIHEYSTCACPITCMAVENPDTIYIGNSDGLIQRLSLSQHTVSLGLHPHPGHNTPIRALSLSPSPVPPKKPTKKTKNKKSNKDNNNNNNNTDNSNGDSHNNNTAQEAVIVWCAYGLGGVKAWDMRNGMNHQMVVCDYSHIPTHLLSTLHSSLSLVSTALPTAGANHATQQLPLPVLNNASHTARATHFSSLPTASSSPSLIHGLLYYQDRLYTAHEEKALGCLNYRIEPAGSSSANAATAATTTTTNAAPAATGAVTITVTGPAESSNAVTEGGAIQNDRVLWMINTEFMDGVNHIILIPTQIGVPAAGTTTAGANSTHSSPTDVKQTNGQDAVHDEWTEQKEAMDDLDTTIDTTDSHSLSDDIDPTSTSATRSSRSASRTSPSPSMPANVASAPYVLCSTFSGHVHIFPLPDVDSEIVQQKQKQQQQPPPRIQTARAQTARDKNRLANTMLAATVVANEGTNKKVGKKGKTKQQEESKEQM